MHQGNSLQPRSRLKDRRRSKSHLRVLPFVVVVLVGFQGQSRAQSPTPSPASNQAPEAKAAQQPQGPVADVIRIDTALVNIPVSVMDHRGRYVPNLRREDFRVYEDGVAQPIAHFAPVTVPFTVALLLDTSGSTRLRLEDIKSAALAFIDQLRPDDRVMVVGFNDRIDLMAEPGSDRQALREAVLRAPAGNGTHLYDVVDFVLNQKFNQISGRKAIILLTDGVDHTSSSTTAASTIHAAEEADALVYSIQYETFFDQTAISFNGLEVIRKTSRLYPPGLGAKDYNLATAYLTDLAMRSGGGLFHAADLGNIAQAFGRIAEQLRSQYSLGYYPKTDEAAGQRRLIKVQLNRSNLVVRARQSYVYRPR